MGHKCCFESINWVNKERLIPINVIILMKLNIQMVKFVFTNYRIDAVGKIYINTTTKIQEGNKFIEEISCVVGIQGDSLSPVMFNNG